MDKCQGIFGKLFGHSYRPAITRGAPSSLKIGEVEGSSSAVIEVINSTSQRRITVFIASAAGR